MSKEELYNKIDKFCNETDWGKYPTYEHALEEFIKGIIAEETKELEAENAELKEALKDKRCHCMIYLNFKDLEKECTKAKEIISELLDSCFGYNAKTVNYEVKAKAEQFLKENA